MTMILKRSMVRLGPWALAFAMILVADVWAQASAPAAGFSSAGANDMRLWSFGDCDRRYPYVNTAERKECVRVVGSVEAKDARAYKMCEVSHEKDAAEIERCKSDYLANKEQAARDGVVPNAPGVPRADLSPEMMRRVKAISSAALEEKKVSASSADTVEPESESSSQPEPSSSMWTVSLIALAGLALGLAVVRRRQAKAA